MLTKQEIRQLGSKEMTDELQRTRRELLKAQFDVRNGISKEVHMLKTLKRYIARLETIAGEMKMVVKLVPTKAEAPKEEEKTEVKKETKVKKSTAKKTTEEKAPAKKAKATKK